MTRLWTVWTVVLVLALCWTTGLAAQELPAEMDPLLELLVEQGVITEEQARAVQAEYDRRRAAEAADVQPTPPPAPSPTPAVIESEEEEPRWYDRIDLRGDLRMRYEGFHQEGAYDDNDQRHRVRLRIRPGIYADVTDWLEVGFQLRTGDPKDPVSDNQSIDGGFSMKAVAISEGYAAFDATDWLDITIGKFDAKKKWVVTDMQWDDDVTVEGGMEELSFGPFEANLYQYFLEEQKSGPDAYLLGGQLLGKFGSKSSGGFTVGVGYDDWVRPQLVADLTLSGDLLGNKVTNLLDDEDQLISDFKIFNAFVNWSSTRNERWPIKLYLFGYHNTGAQGLGKDYDTGYFARLQVGDYKEKGQLMFRYSRYYSEPDAIFYVFAQSDTTRASDVDGHRFDLRIGYVKRSYFNLTWYRTKAVYADVSTMDRLQVDYIIRF
jgi:hypothetical protein